MGIRIESEGEWQFFDPGNPDQIDMDPLPPTYDAMPSGRAVWLTGNNGIYLEVREDKLTTVVESLAAFFPKSDQIEVWGDVIKDESHPPTISYILSGPEATFCLKGDSIGSLTIRRLPDPKVFQLVKEVLNALPVYI